MGRDALDEQIAKRAARNPRYPQMVQEAIARQDRAGRAASERKAAVNYPARDESVTAQDAARRDHEAPV